VTDLVAGSGTAATSEEDVDLEPSGKITVSPHMFNAAQVCGNRARLTDFTWLIPVCTMPLAGVHLCSHVYRFVPSVLPHPGVRSLGPGFA